MSLGRSSSVFALLALAALAGAPMLTTSCTSTYYPPLCESYVTRCRTVCQTWCDDYGCFPSCRDECWDECTVNPPPPPGVRVPSAEGGAPPAPSLCMPCQANDDCGGLGALCVRQGGASEAGDAGEGGGAGFCGQACNDDCPTGYTCSVIGSSHQCVPSSGTCPESPM